MFYLTVPNDYWLMFASTETDGTVITLQIPVIGLQFNVDGSITPKTLNAALNVDLTDGTDTIQLNHYILIQDSKQAWSTLGLGIAVGVGIDVAKSYLLAVGPPYNFAKPPSH